MRSFLLPTLAMLAMAVAVTAAVAPGTSAAEGGTGQIHIVAQPGNSSAPWQFSPGTLTVAAGTTVTWTDDVNVYHTVTSTDSLDAKKSNGQFSHAFSAQGDTFQFTFDKPGTFYYFCQPHAEFMQGTIVVTPATAPAGSTSPPTSSGSDQTAKSTPGAPLPLVLGMLGLAGLVLRRRA